jgi:transcriptional regulator with XRE-family HTH domain
MGREKIEPQPVDDEVKSIIARLLDDAGMSRRSLAEASGVKRGRLDNVFAQDGSLYVGELFLIAHALGTSASAIITEAEGGSSDAPAAPPFAPAPEGDRWWEGEDVAALDPGYSPRMEEDQPDPDPDDWGA